MSFIRDLYRAQVGQGVYIYFLLHVYGLSLCSKNIMNRLSKGKDAHIRTHL